MDFKELISRAQDGSETAQEELLNLYRGLLMKYSIVDGMFEEDLYQEMCITFLRCIREFNI